MTRRHTAGFTLLELLVAIAVMGMSLGLLYRASGGAVRNVGAIEHLQQAMLVAQSLRALHEDVPQHGWNATGRSAGHDWQVRSAPYDAGAADVGQVPLHEVQIVVRWDDAGQARAFELWTLLPQQRAAAAEAAP
nr:prepilin-type N-terminal cleavage/methylation domain-containing protein [Variovorax boronicumulans]